MVSDAEAVELGSFDQRIDCGSAAAAGIGAGKQVILAANGDTAQGTLGGIVVECQPAVVEANAPTRSSAPAYSKAWASSDLRESQRTVYAAHAAQASAIGFDRNWRCCCRRWGGEPLMVFSTNVDDLHYHPT